MYKSVILFLVLVTYGTSILAQTVIDQKGTKTLVDTSKWHLNGTNIYNKNIGNVGIGTNGIANSNAALEVKATDKGLLIPRIALTSTTAFAPLSAHVAGMLIYNTATAGSSPLNVTPGFYFNDGTKWIRLADAAGTDPTKDAWIDDNLNTQVKLNTLSDGTTARPLGTEVVIKDNARIGVGTSSPSWMLDVQGADAIGQFKRFASTSNSQATGILLIRARGTSTAQGDILNGDYLGKIQFRGRVANTDTDFGTLSYLVDNATGITGHFAFTKSDLITPVMVINSGDGNVGIGTATPNSRLNINGYAKLGSSDVTADALVTASNRAGMIRYNTTSNNFQYHDNTQWITVANTAKSDTTRDAWIDDPANTQVKLGTLSNGTTTRTLGAEFVIKDNGDVGIGNASPSARLQVETKSTGNSLSVSQFFAPLNTTAGQTTQLRLGTAASNNNSSEFRFFNTGLGSTSNRLDFGFFGTGSWLSILASGNVGIGETNPSAKLEVNGNLEISTVDAVQDNILYRPLVWNSTTNRVETSMANTNNINKTITIAAGATSSVQTLTVTGNGAYDVKVMVGNGCGAVSYNKFILAGATAGFWSINHIGGTSQNGAATVDGSSTRSSKYIHNPLNASCGDGGNTTALDYTITINEATGELSVKNNGNISKSYLLIIEKAFD